MPAKKAPQKLFWPVFPNENCLINLSTEAFCVRVNTLHRIGLKQQCPRDIDPLTPFKTKSPDNISNYLSLNLFKMIDQVEQVSGLANF